MQKPKWHPWTFNRSNLTLEHPNSYWVDLERCNTSAEMLDWIFQVNTKGWATPEVIAGLVHALRDLLHPQANLCSMGVERGPINPERVIKKQIEKREITPRRVFVQQPRRIPTVPATGVPITPEEAANDSPPWLA